MSSWKALAWAKDQQTGSPLTKLVLLLLAERADEAFSCFPGVPLLAKEAEATERGVQIALRRLEAAGLITTRGRSRVNGSRASNRFRLAHPDGPPPDLTEHDEVIHRGEHSSPPPRTQFTTPPNTVHPTGVNTVHPLNYPLEPPTYQSAHPPQARETARALLDGLGPGWRLGPKRRDSLIPAVVEALDGGWSPAALAEHLRATPAGALSPGAVLRWRLSDLPTRDGLPTLVVPPHCGVCDERTRQVEVGDTVRRCAVCHPLAAGTPTPRRWMVGTAQAVPMAPQTRSAESEPAGDRTGVPR